MKNTKNEGATTRLISLLNLRQKNPNKLKKVTKPLNGGIKKFS